jgi:enoyl-CoA hydratase
VTLILDGGEVVPGYRYLTVEALDGGQIARILMNRPHTRNALNRGLLIELDRALRAAEEDDDVRVVILGGVGPVFCSGHDLGSADALRERSPGPDQHITERVNGGSRRGPERRMLQEWHYYFDNKRRWRNLRKITIAQVQGPVYAAGLMLMWCCDLIVADDDARFADVVGARLGLCGTEYFAHPWEFGPRRAKELLLTGDAIDAAEAYRLGMVSKIFPRPELEDRTLEYARRIVKNPTMTALLIKDSVNQTVDMMGFYNALNACFSLHQVNHSHWAVLTSDASGVGTPEYGLPARGAKPGVRMSVPDAVLGPEDASGQPPA